MVTIVNRERFSVILSDLRSVYRGLIWIGKRSGSGYSKTVTRGHDYEGSEGEKKARIFLAQLSIPYDALTKEEFVVLVGILKKSEHMKIPYNQRGTASPHPSHGRGKKKLYPVFCAEYSIFRLLPNPA